MFIEQISVLNILNMLYNLHFFSLQNAIYFIMLPCLVSVLLTFYIQGVLKLKKKSVAKRLIFLLTFRPILAILRVTMSSGRYTSFYRVFSLPSWPIIAWSSLRPTLHQRCVVGRVSIMEARQTIAVMISFKKCNKNWLEHWVGVYRSSRKRNALYNFF